MNGLDQVRAVADALLYEGYLLYPYRASAQKNQSRFQFGVLVPPGYRDPSERSALRTECLLEAKDDARLELLLRFLRLRRRCWTGPLSLRGRNADGWDEAEDIEITGSATVGALLAGGVDVPFHLPAAGDKDWHTAAVDGVLRVVAERIDGPYRVVRLRARVENSSPGEFESREQALPSALVSAHVLMRVDAGSFLSMVEPPEWAAPYIARCVNDGVWPVLAGTDDSVLLCSPIILYDHPVIAPESPADLYDATEIDEILTLRTMALTDAEKAEARATDPRAAALIDRVDGMGPDMLDKLHGAIRYLRPAQETAVPEPDPSVPWWDPGMDTSVSPDTDEVLVAGIPVKRGSTVRMRPGARRADAQDFLLADRLAVVEAVLHDVDGKVHVAVTPSDEPDADLARAHGRFLYFAPDELEPL